MWTLPEIELRTTCTEALQMELEIGDYLLYTHARLWCMTMYVAVLRRSRGMIAFIAGDCDLFLSHTTGIFSLAFCFYRFPGAPRNLPCSSIVPVCKQPHSLKTTITEGRREGAKEMRVGRVAVLAKCDSLVIVLSKRASKYIYFSFND